MPVELQALHQDPFCLRQDVGALRRRTFHIIMQKSGKHIHRFFSRETEIHRAAHPVDVRPASQNPPLITLLRCGKIGFKNHGMGRLHIAEFSGSAEIQKLKSAVRHEHQVVRADVPVNDACIVHTLHGLHDRAEAPDDLFHCPASIFWDQFAQGNAVQVFHHDIGCRICLKVVQNRNDRLIRCKIMERPRFLQKTIQI